MLGIQYDVRTSGKFITSHDLELSGCLVLYLQHSQCHMEALTVSSAGVLCMHTARGPVCWVAFVFSLLSLTGYFLD